MKLCVLTLRYRTQRLFSKQRYVCLLVHKRFRWQSNAVHAPIHALVVGGMLPCTAFRTQTQAHILKYYTEKAAVGAR